MSTKNTIVLYYMGQPHPCGGITWNSPLMWRHHMGQPRPCGGITWDSPAHMEASHGTVPLHNRYSNGELYSLLAKNVHLHSAFIHNCAMLLIDPFHDMNILYFGCDVIM